MIDLDASGRTGVVSAAGELIERGGQTDKMKPSKKECLMSRQTKEHLTDQCVMVSLTAHLGTSVEAFVEGHVDTTVEDLQTDRKEQGLMNSQRSERSTVAIVHHDEVDFVAVVVTVLVSETAVKERMQTMPMARIILVLMSNKEGTHQTNREIGVVSVNGENPTSREIEEVLVNGKNDRDSMKMWNDRDLTTEEVDENLFVVAEVVDVDLVEVGEVLTDQERETTIDILKGMFGFAFNVSFYFLFLCCKLAYLLSIAL